MELPPKSTRLFCSLLAIAAGWLLNEAWYFVYNAGHDTFFWLFWTGIFCALGWILVGLPIVRLSRYILNKPLWLIIPLTGAAGAAIMLVPTLLVTVGSGQTKGLLNPLTWFFCIVAFFVAAATMAFYRLFLWVATGTALPSSSTKR